MESNVPSADWRRKAASTNPISRGVRMRIGLLSPVLIFGLGAAVLLPARAQQTPPVTLQGDLHAKLEAEINRVADRLNGVLGYAIKDLSTGESFYHNADLVFPTAS